MDIKISRTGLIIKNKNQMIPARWRAWIKLAIANMKLTISNSYSKVLVPFSNSVLLIFIVKPPKILFIYRVVILWGTRTKV